MVFRSLKSCSSADGCTRGCIRARTLAVGVLRRAVAVFFSQRVFGLFCGFFLWRCRYQFPLLCGVDVGCPLDFIDVSALRVPRRRPGEPAPALHPDDAELLHDEQDALAAMRADLLKQHWVQKEMISENTVHSDHHHVSQVEREEKQLKRAKAEEQRLLDQFQDGRSMAERIEDGFRFANAPELPPHPTKGDSVKPVRSWPLVPHDELHGRKYGTMHFDHDFAKKVAMPFPEAAEYVVMRVVALSLRWRLRPLA